MAKGMPDLSARSKDVGPSVLGPLLNLYDLVSAFFFLRSLRSFAAIQIVLRLCHDRCVPGRMR